MLTPSLSREDESRNQLGRNLTVGLVDQLGKAIVTGHFEDRPFPTEAALETQYPVSRSVIREAVKMLTAKGLVSARPRQGTVVQPSSHWNLFDKDVLRWILDRKFSLVLLRQFTELRIAIEPKGAELAARMASYDDLNRMQAAFQRMVQADQGHGDPTQADIAFHVSILLASGNPFYMQFQDLVSTALQTSIKFTTRVNGVTPNLEAHENIMKAIFDRDPPRAFAAMHLIVNDVLSVIYEQDTQKGFRS